MKYAPIVIFCYRRSILDLIDSLKSNTESKFSSLFIYSDGYKSEVDKNDVKAVREELKTITGFESVDLILARNNKGLANSIIDGVSEQITKSDKVIVLEDDLIVSPYFLKFMNRALELYKFDPKIWSISGYSPRLPCLENHPLTPYLSVRASSWGWATWSDRWAKVDWSLKDYMELKDNKSRQQDFELGGNDLFKMLELQHLGKIDSWAIRFCYSQFLAGSYSVTPAKSLVVNNGFESLGTHNNDNGEKWMVSLCDAPITVAEVEVDDSIIQCFKKYHDLPLFSRIGYFLKKYGGHRFVKNILNLLKR